MSEETEVLSLADDSVMVCSDLDNKRKVCALNGEIGLYKRRDITNYKMGLNPTKKRVLDRGKGYLNYYKSFMNKEQKQRFNELRRELSKIAKKQELLKGGSD